MGCWSGARVEWWGQVGAMSRVGSTYIRALVADWVDGPVGTWGGRSRWFDTNGLGRSVVTERFLGEYVHCGRC